jgi:hypothetical protein
VRTNFDKGNGARSGIDVVFVGDFVGGSGSCDPDLGVYALKSLSTGENGPVLTSDSEGRLWLIVGTDSGFEGKTTIYYTEGVAVFTPL